MTSSDDLVDYLLRSPGSYTVPVVCMHFLVNCRFGDEEVHTNYAHRALHGSWDIVEVFIVSLSTRSAESTRAVSVSDARNEWRKVLSMPIPLDTPNDKEKPFCRARDTTGLT